MLVNEIEWDSEPYQQKNNYDAKYDIHDLKIINVKDDNGITLVEYTLNNQDYVIDLTKDTVNYDAINGLTLKRNSNNNIIEFQYRQIMNEKGRNDIIIKATNKKEAKATYEGFCNND